MPNLDIDYGTIGSAFAALGAFVLLCRQTFVSRQKRWISSISEMLSLDMANKSISANEAVDSIIVSRAALVVKADAIAIQRRWWIGIGTVYMFLALFFFVLCLFDLLFPDNPLIQAVIVTGILVAGAAIFMKVSLMKGNEEDDEEDEVEVEVEVEADSSTRSERWFRLRRPWESREMPVEATASVSPAQGHGSANGQTVSQNVTAQ